MKRLPHLLVILTGLVLLSFVAHAAKDEAPPPVKLTAEDKKDLARVEAYFNSMPTVQADFTETAERPNGTKGSADGTFKLWRPGRMRIDYANSTGDFVVADGKTLHFWDGELKQESRTGIDDTLAGVILRPDFSLEDDITVTKVERPSSGELQVNVRSADDPAAGELMLLMNSDPVELKGWRILDGQGLFTQVDLRNIRTDVKFDKADFRFVKPKVEGRRQR